MDLTEEERRWAMAIKETLTNECAELAATTTDFEYAHHAIIAKEKVHKAIRRIKRLHKFRQDNGIPLALDELDAHTGMKAIRKFEKSATACSWHLAQNATRAVMMENFSYYLETRAAHLCQDAYPIRISSLIVLHAPTVFTVMYALIKPFLTQKVRNALQLTGTTQQVHEQFSKELISISLGGTHDTSDAQQAMFQGLQKRYANMATFKL
ncbi:expressed unknown protein [Seminavis robusta]|uniref:CRAL-TRIO domain-containing protein n=1 Tax=Seminavis robusta TaxID=568900 RepID=A0A9N8HAH9_9STRA|nr:expressed unknown protein [Seminavis robusta]|eukprot:Sro149_g068420.1 n/a (210) ;mRNA; r:43110-43902